MYQYRQAVTQEIGYEFCVDFYKQLKANVDVIIIGNFVIVIVIGKIKCNCNLIVIGINVIDPCLFCNKLNVTFTVVIMEFIGVWPFLYCPHSAMKPWCKELWIERICFDVSASS